MLIRKVVETIFELDLGLWILMTTLISVGDLLDLSSDGDLGPLIYLVTGMVLWLIFMGRALYRSIEAIKRKDNVGRW